MSGRSGGGYRYCSEKKYSPIPKLPPGREHADKQRRQKSEPFPPRHSHTPLSLFRASSGTEVMPGGNPSADGFAVTTNTRTGI